MNRSRIDGLTVVSIALILFMAYSVMTDSGMVKPTMASALEKPAAAAPRASAPQASAPTSNEAQVALATEAQMALAAEAKAAQASEAQVVVVPQLKAKPKGAAAPAAQQAPNLALGTLKEQESIVAPYKNFALTQGLHSSAYDQNAIDIAAGKGTPIMSPINGVVKQVFTDQFGNTTIVIENDVYRVTMLHGDYTAQVGEQVKQGQPVGTESNHGLTFDGTGRSCQGRDCGYHTHINIFDKRIGAYANPLELLKIQ